MSDRTKNIKRFESPEAFGDWLGTLDTRYFCESSQGKSWCGGGLATGLPKLMHGDTSSLSEAQQILSKIDDREFIANGVPMLTPAMAGFVPNVPAFLAGQPVSMFNKHIVGIQSPQSPISVFVEVVVSAGVEHHEIMQRGIAVLAFVLALECRRPVDLYATHVIAHSNAPGAFGTVVKIASKPMDLGRACFMLTDPAYTRGCGLTANFALAESTDTSGPWLFGGTRTPGYVVHMRELLELQPDDIFIPGGHLFDKLALTKSVEWVNKKLAKAQEHHV